MKPFKFLARTAPILFGNLSFIDNQQVMFAKQFPVTALSLHFTAQTLPNNINQTRLPVFLVKSFNKNLTKNTWIIFWWIKI
jgi:hypothetical protein